MTNDLNKLQILDEVRSNVMAISNHIEEEYQELLKYLSDNGIEIDQLIDKE